MTYQRYLHKTDKKVKDSFPRFRHIGYMALDVCFYRPISTRCVMQSVPCQSLLLSRTLCPKAGWSWKIFRKLHCQTSFLNCMCPKAGSSWKIFKEPHCQTSFKLRNFSVFHSLPTVAFSKFLFNLLFLKFYFWIITVASM